MMRMASTDLGDDRAEVARRSARLERYSREVDGMSPEPAPESHVGLHIGAGHVLDDLSAIEPLPGAGRQLRERRRRRGGGAAPFAAAFGRLPGGACSAQHLPSITPPPLPGTNADNKRITIEFSHISAHVPLLFQQPSLLKKLNPLALRQRISQIGSNKATHRQVQRTHQCNHAALPLPASSIHA
jgi:hypothetical protein